MGTGEDSTAKPSKPSSSTSSTQIPLAPSYPDWSSSMQAYYAPGVTPPPFFASTVASPSPHPYLWGSQESATNKKRSFNQMLVDGANTQNNSVGATAVPGKPAVSTMSTTNLNIGMELWNASSAPGAVTPSTIRGREVTLGRT